MENLINLWNQGEHVLAANAIAPFLDWLHIAKWTDDPLLIARFLMTSLLQVCIVGLVFRSLELLFPLEKQTKEAVAAYSTQTGHPFHGKVDSRSVATRVM